MKKIAYSLIALAMSAFTFTSCEDVPAPFTQPDDPSGGGGGGGTIIVDPTGSGTVADPYNVQAALDIAKAMSGDDAAKEVVAAGYISSIEEIDTEGTYGNATYYISDDKDGKSNKLEVYRGYGLNGQKFNAKDATIIKQGDFVVVSGGLVNFKGSTPEFTQGSKILSINGQGGGTEPSGETLGTKDNPLTIDQALAEINKLADGGESSQFAYVKGKVVKVTTNQANFEKYGNLNYLISVDGTENGKEITVYSGDGLDGAKFTSINDLAQGDEVVIYGKLYKYVNKNTGAVTPEINKGNYLVSLVKGSGGGGGGDEPAGETLGTKDSPLNVAQALELINALADKAESEKFAYVKGKVVKVTTNQTNFEKYGNLNYLISDDGTENSTITVYSGDGLNGAKFSGPGDLEPGDEVIVYGKLYKYVNNSGAVTPEINKGNYLVSLVKGQGGGGGDEPGGGSEPGGGAEAGSSITVVTADLGLGNQEKPSTLTLSDGTTLTFSDGGNKNAPAYYNTGTALRMYPQNTMVINAGSKKIVSIEIVCDEYNGTLYNASGDITVNSTKMTIDGTSLKFTGPNASTATVANASSTTGAASQLRMKTLIITYAK